MADLTVKHPCATIGVTKDLSVVINCEKVSLVEGGISINIPNDTISSFKYIVINGIRFKQEED